MEKEESVVYMGEGEVYRLILRENKLVAQVFISTDDWLLGESFNWIDVSEENQVRYVNDLILARMGID